MNTLESIIRGIKLILKNKEEHMKKVTVTLADDYYEEISKMAEEYEISMSKCCRIYIHEGLEAFDTEEKLLEEISEIKNCIGNIHGRLSTMFPESKKIEINEAK
jgi:hypothetical protein